jgi:hypothetical protein
LYLLNKFCRLAGIYLNVDNKIWGLKTQTIS